MQNTYNFTPLDKLRSRGSKELIWYGILIFVLSVVSGILLALPGPLTTIVLIVGFVAMTYSFVQSQRTDTKIAYNNQIVLSEFAAQNNLSFSAGGALSNPDEVGSIFKHGYSKWCTNIISGTSHELPFYLFNYQYTTGQGKSRTTYRLAVMSVELPHSMPQLVIDSLVEEGVRQTSTLPITFDSSQKISLEGDFSQFFAVYAPKNHGIDALTVLAPDVMQTLLTKNAFCDMEIIGKRIYFYWPLTLEKRKDYEEILPAFEAVMNQIAAPILNMQPTEIASAIQTADASRPLLKERSPLGIIIGMIVLYGVIFSMSRIIYAATGDSLLPSLLPLLMVGVMAGWFVYRIFVQKHRARRLRGRYGR